MHSNKSHCSLHWHAACSPELVPERRDSHGIEKDSLDAPAACVCKEEWCVDDGPTVSQSAVKSVLDLEFRAYRA